MSPAEERVVPVWATRGLTWAASAYGDNPSARPAVLVLCREGESREELAERIGALPTAEEAEFLWDASNYYTMGSKAKDDALTAKLRALAALRTPQEPSNE